MWSGARFDPFVCVLQQRVQAIVVARAVAACEQRGSSLARQLLLARAQRDVDAQQLGFERELSTGKLFVIPVERARGIGGVPGSERLLDGFEGAQLRAQAAIV